LQASSNEVLDVGETSETTSKPTKVTFAMVTDRNTIPLLERPSNQVEHMSLYN
jgi:hypothetical protein